MASPTKSSAPRRHGCWISAGVVVILVAIAGGVLLAWPRTGSASGLATTRVKRGTIIATVSGTGTIAAVQTLDLPFQVNGIVSEVLVAEGDLVRAGQPLARLDDRDLKLQLASAELALESARTKSNQIAQGNVKQADIAVQQASIASAQAQLRQAQAQMDALRRPAQSTLSTTEFNLRQAEINLQAARDNSSAQKTKAEQDLHKAAESLTQAQSKYATAKSNWEWVQENGTNPLSPETSDGQGGERKNTLSDGEQRQYYDQFIQAEAALRQAEQAVQQAQVAFDNARQQEVANIQQAEAKLADAQRQLASLGNPSKTDLAQRQAGVDQAQASLNQARANLAKLSAPGTESDIALQELAVAQSEQSLAQVKLKLEQTTLRAPFDGIITTVNIVPGSAASGAQAAFRIVDRSVLHVDLALSENDVAKVQLKQSVALGIEALKDWQAQGSVSYIAPSGESTNNVVTYKVRVSFPDSSERVKVGMTATLAITTATREQVLLVPNTALLPKGAGRVVQVPNQDGTTREVDVEIGLSDGTNTEITRGLNEGDVIVATPGVARPQRRGIFGP